jgi:starch phosphorylase
MSNRPLSTLIDDTIGTGWEDDLDRLKELEPHILDAGFLSAFDTAKRRNKIALARWIADETGITVAPDAIFDVQIKRIHEYKRQLMNILQTVAHYQAIKANPGGPWVPRVKIFGGKSAPGYVAAKEIIHLINDVALVINTDSEVGDLLKVIYPPNYNISMAERLIPAADLSEQISTAGKEASGTGNMKFMMNGAPTIGTLDGANVEILQEVGEENFFLFGMTAEEVSSRREDPDHARKAIEACLPLQSVLQDIYAGRFSPDQPDRFHGLVHRVWHHDYFLVASDFAAYNDMQGKVDLAYADRSGWLKMAALNTARSGFFSSDRTIRGYMAEVWDIPSAF